MVRAYYYTLPESQWTEEEEADYDERERAQNYGMTWKEWCAFVESHTGSEIIDFQMEYCKTHGKKWPQGNYKRENDNGIVLDVFSHQNDLGMGENKIG